MLALIPLIIVVGVLGPTIPQSGSPSFEVASVKANRSADASWRIACGQGKCRATNASLTLLIAEAYGLRPFTAGDYISGLPGWAKSEKYDVEGKSENPSAIGSEHVMLQTLLRDRFKLTLHEQTREVTGYMLVVAKGGPKLRPSEQRKTGPVACGTDGTTRGLVSCLSDRLNQPIIDKTNITGRYDFTVALDLLPAGGDFLTGPSVSSLLEEQFGLKLESQKVPVKFLIIDHAEKPTEN
jgi:uncharacterized protein (TIGR03435 family)